MRCHFNILGQYVMYPAERFQLQDNQLSPLHQKPSAEYHSLYSMIWAPLVVSNPVARWNVSSFLELFLEWPSHYWAHWKVALWNVGLPFHPLLTPKPFFGDLLKHFMISLFFSFSWGEALGNFAIKNKKQKMTQIVLLCNNFFLLLILKKYCKVIQI